MRTIFCFIFLCHPEFSPARSNLGCLSLLCKSVHTILCFEWSSNKSRKVLDSHSRLTSAAVLLPFLIPVENCKKKLVTLDSNFTFRTHITNLYKYSVISCVSEGITLFLSPCIPQLVKSQPMDTKLQA